ncbi:hypothetical protein Vi05172_g11813 [Venturia inaequalis]|uniref:Uncharacterized protein n=1 Tax=Venturia inaequalis TaxID=5025 RepID=A0A8H3UIS2_VENIN|nr:hypothetical protein EG327_009876 [Venturia inaequalis]RDI78204.1 hypothetical protein Vi05172_g11813 [Venturia inaequalis]
MQTSSAAALDALSSVRFNHPITGTRTDEELDLAWEERAAFAELIAAHLRDIYLPELEEVKNELSTRISSEHEANARNEELRKYEHEYLTRIKGLEEQITEELQLNLANLANLNGVIAKYKAKTAELEKENAQIRHDAVADVDELSEQLKHARAATASAEEDLGTAEKLYNISQKRIVGLLEDMESLRQDVNGWRQCRQTDRATQTSAIVDETKRKPSGRASSLPPRLKDRKQGYDRFSPKTFSSSTVFNEDDAGPSSPMVHNPVTQVRALQDAVREFGTDPNPRPKNRLRLPKHLHQLQKYLYYVALTISYFVFLIVAWSLSWSISRNFDNPELMCELQRAFRESSYMTLVYLLTLRPASFGTIMVEVSFYCQGHTRPIWTRIHSLFAMAFTVVWLYVFHKVLNKWLPRLKPAPEGRGGQEGGRTRRS